MAMEPYRDRVNVRPLGTVMRKNFDTGAAGRSIAAGGQAIADGLNDVAKFVEARDVLLADTESRSAFEEFARRERTIMYDPQTGALTRNGGNGRDILQSTEERLKEAQDEIAAGLSPIARRKFLDRTTATVSSDLDGVARHSAVQTENYVVSGREATIKTEVENSSLAYRDPAKAEQHLSVALAEIDELGALQGLPPEAIAAEKAKATSTSLMARIVRTAVDDPVGAQALLDANRHRVSSQHQATLDNALKDGVNQAKADAIIAPYIGAAAAPSASGLAVSASDDPNAIMPSSGGRTAGGGRAPKDTTEALIMRAESGGRLTAENPGEGQTAAGPHQFTRGTFVGTVRQMVAAGQAPWAEGLSENEIARIRTTNPDLEGEVYDYFRAQNQQTIRAAGQTLTPTNEYVVHHFGRGGGAAILKASPGTPGSAILKNWDGIVKANPWMRADMTAGEIIDGATRFLGLDPRSVAGNYIDEVGASAAISQIEDPAVRAKAMQSLQQQMSLENIAKDALSQQAFDQAWNAYKTQGLTNIPLDLQLAMGPGKLSALQSTIAGEETGALKTDPDTYEYLTNLASNPNTREEFARKELRYYWPSMTEADRRHFTDQQAAVRAVLADPSTKFNPMAQDFAGAWAQVSETVGAVVGTGKDVDIDRKLNMQTQFNAAMVRKATELGRELNQLEVQEIATGLATKITYNPVGFTQGDTPGAFFEVGTLPPGTPWELNLGIEDVTPQERAAIGQRMLESGFVNPTSDDIVKEAEGFRRARLTATEDSWGQAATTPEEVPTQYLEMALAEGWSEEQAVAVYNAYVVENLIEEYRGPTSPVLPGYDIGAPAPEDPDGWPEDVPTEPPGQPIGDIPQPGWSATPPGQPPGAPLRPNAGTTPPAQPGALWRPNIFDGRSR